MQQFCISNFQRAFLSIQKKNNLVGACLTNSLVSSSVLTQLNIQHKIAPGFIVLGDLYVIDHFWIQANDKVYDFTAFEIEIPDGMLKYHLEKPKGKEYFLGDTAAEMLGTGSILSEWKRIGHLPVETGLALHFDQMVSMIGNQPMYRAWKSMLTELNQYLGSNSVPAKIEFPKN
jgi:hypothetical protein